MMKMKALALGFGIGFGFLLGWARLTDPDVIQDMLRLREFDLYALMGSAVVVAFAGAHLLRRVGARSWVDHQAIGWATSSPTRAHVTGSLIFGLGWGLAGTCPGPVAAQLGRGQAAALATMAGILAGAALLGHLRARTSHSSSSPPDAAQAGASSPGL